MSNSPLVSVIMPAYNCSKFIEQAIESIINQTYKNFEFLICNDCSSDDTLSIIEFHALRDSRIKVFNNEQNKGYLKTWNYLIEKAQGDFITFQDADDFCVESRLEILLNALLADTNTHVVGSGIAVVSENNIFLREKKYPTKWEDIQTQLLEKFSFPFCGSAVMIRKKVYEITGGYRDFFDRVGWEDHDWLIRICENHKAKNVLEILYYYRETSNSVTRSISSKDIRKLVIKDIGIELAKQRMQSGVDMIIKGDDKSLENLIYKYERKFNENPALIYQILAGKYLNIKGTEFWINLRSAFLKEPFSVKNLKLLIKRLI